MGLRYRKSFGSKAGRVTVSKSGVGFSVGGKGYRVTKKAGGGYRTTSSIPGTGISYVSDYGNKSSRSGSTSKGSGKGCGCLLSVVIVLLSLGLIGALGEIFSPEDGNSQVEENAVVETIVDQTDEATESQTADQDITGTAPLDSETVADDAIHIEPDVTVVEDTAGPVAEDPVFIPPLDPLAGVDNEVPSEIQPEPSAPPQEATQGEQLVYYTDTGSKYHRAGCRHLSESKHETTLDYAVNTLGLSPCGTCF